MSDELILIHIGFIVALVYTVFRSGEKSGRVQMVEDMLDRGLITETDLVNKYNIKDKHT
jgi:transcription initiation factor IIE alpha subunit